jgi:hypothetical protein
MFEVEYLVYRSVKSKTFDTYAAALAFFNNVRRQNYCSRAELKNLTI